MRSCKTAGLLAAIALPLLLVGGCTGSDVISTGNAGVVIQVPVSNPDTRYDIRSAMKVAQISIAPQDPEAEASLGSSPLVLFSTPADLIDVEFATQGVTDPTPVVISSGLYTINLLQIVQLDLVATRQDPFEWDECDEFFSFFLAALELDADDLGDMATIRVPEGGAGALNISIDATTLIEAFTNTWQCTPPPNPIPIIFDEAAFKKLIPTYLEIELVDLPG